MILAISHSVHYFNALVTDCVRDSRIMAGKGRSAFIFQGRFHSFFPFFFFFSAGRLSPFIHVPDIHYAEIL